ncbi:FAD/NAD(P)-binding domain-containing protein [Viridothelium virens]|uniref:FAD/NAD(P)-binding domain-containing protein n=1 Tax=Viridothelium virens TaxID=1048519 RepID=A0A6A6HEY2_VIRVR|nr:FAD/NAD(P)-binding domain-containing protein [Viridothelium virens]
MTRKQIAIVGSGCAGLGALWALKSTNHEVHIFEADDRLGGHTNTVTFTHRGHSTPVDTGFIVLNTATYPNFINFLKCINVRTVETEMSFGISRDQGAFEWAGNSLSSLFAQWSNIISPRHWRMIFDIARFNQFALDLLSDDDGHDNASSHQTMEESMGDYLCREGYSNAFRDNYIIPMTACVWSTSPDDCSLSFPVKTLVRFLWNHHLLTTVSTRPPWLTIPGGSKSYVDAIMRNFPEERIHLNNSITSITSNRSGSMILHTDIEGEQWMFDEVILACHGDQALDIISASATEVESDILGTFHTSANNVYLHSDLSLMPKRRATWSSWNYLTTSRQTSSSTSQKPPIYDIYRGDDQKSRHLGNGHSNPSPSLEKVSLTYNMNILQHIPASLFGDVLVTMNPPHPPASSTIQGEYQYSHPLYTPEAVAAQGRLPEIQNTRGLLYCGAWTKYGFHEDGFTSGLEVATKYLGAQIPFEVVDSRYSRGVKPELKMKDHATRAVIGFIQTWIVLVERLFRFAWNIFILPFWVLEQGWVTIRTGLSWALMVAGVWEQDEAHGRDLKGRKLL